MTITDEYLDAADLRLTTKDYWLRIRDGELELKEVAPPSPPLRCDDDGSMPPAIPRLLLPHSLSMMDILRSVLLERLGSRFSSDQTGNPKHQT